MNEEIFERRGNGDPELDLDEHERAARFVRKFVQKSDEYRRPHLELATDARELYECWSRQTRSKIQRANLKLPYGFEIIETELPQLTDIFLKEKPLFKFIGRNPFDMQFEERLNDFHSMQVDRMRFQEKFISWTKSLLLDGTAIAKFPYRFEERVVTERKAIQDPMTGEVSYAKEKKLGVMFDGPDMEYIALHDFFPDWRATQAGDIRSMRGVAHRTWKTFSELKRSGLYKNIDELQTSLRVRGSNAMSAPMWSSEQINKFDVLNDNEQHIKRDELVEVWEYWGEYDKDKDGEFVECLITVINGDTCCRLVENFYDTKFKPFAAAVNIPRDGEFYGIPELMSVKGSIKEATVLRNARLDQTNLNVNRMFVVDRSAGIKQNTLFTRPNGIIYTNDMNGIRALEMPDSSPVSAQEIQMLQQEIQNATGLAAAAPTVSKLASTFGRSATGAQMVQNFQSSRIGLKARLIAYSFIHQMQRIMFETNAQFVTEEQWIRVSDPNAAEQNPFTSLPPDAFSGDFNFELSSSFEDSSEETFGKMQQFIQLAGVAEQTQPGTIKWGPVFEETGRDLLGRKIKNFIRSDAERQQLMMQQMAAEQAGNGMAGARAPQKPNGGQQ